MHFPISDQTGYRAHLDSFLQNPDLVSTHSLQIRTNEQGFIHSYAIIPPNPKRIEIIHGGLGNTIAKSAAWLGKLANRDCAIFLIEPRGHGTISSPYDTGNAALMSTDARRVYHSFNLYTFLEQHPKLQGLKFHEIGISMGGGTVVENHVRSQGRLVIGSVRGRNHAIDSITLINPRLELGENYSFLLRRIVAPTLRKIGAHWPALEKHLHTPFIAGKPLLPSEVPLAYGTTVFAHDEKLSKEWRRPSNKKIMPRMLMGLDLNDTECNPRRGIAFFARHGGPTSYLLRLFAHNPLYNTDTMDRYLDAVVAFQDKKHDPWLTTPHHHRQIIAAHYYFNKSLRKIRPTLIHTAFGMATGVVFSSVLSAYLPFSELTINCLSVTLPHLLPLVPFRFLPRKPGVSLNGHLWPKPSRGVLKSELISVLGLWGFTRIMGEGHPYAPFASLGLAYGYDLVVPLLRGSILDWQMSRSLGLLSKWPVAMLGVLAGMTAYALLTVNDDL